MPSRVSLFLTIKDINSSPIQTKNLSFSFDRYAAVQRKRKQRIFQIFTTKKPYWFELKEEKSTGVDVDETDTSSRTLYK